jgi:hypothetical protein
MYRDGLVQCPFNFVEQGFVESNNYLFNLLSIQQVEIPMS